MNFLLKKKLVGQKFLGIGFWVLGIQKIDFSSFPRGPSEAGPVLKKVIEIADIFFSNPDRWR